MPLVFIILSSLLYLIGFIPYMYHVFRGRVVPHPFSWTIWCIFALTSASILLQSSGLSYALIPIGIRIISLLIGAFFGWYYIDRIHLGRVDYITLSLALIAIAGMRYYGDNSTIGLIIIIDFLVLTPTLKKLWINPKSEDSLAWVMAAISQACLILSIENMNFASVGYIVYLTLVNASVALLIYRRRLYLGYWWNRMKNMLPKIAIKRRFW